MPTAATSTAGRLTAQRRGQRREHGRLQHERGEDRRGAPRSPGAGVIATRSRCARRAGRSGRGDHADQVERGRRDRGRGRRGRSPVALACTAVTVPTGRPAAKVDEPAGPVSSWSPALRSARRSQRGDGEAGGAGAGGQRQLAAAHVADADARARVGREQHHRGRGVGVQHPADQAGRARDRLVDRDPAAACRRRWSTVQSKPWPGPERDDPGRHDASGPACRRPAAAAASSRAVCGVVGVRRRAGSQLRRSRPRAG